MRALSGGPAEEFAALRADQRRRAQALRREFAVYAQRQTRRLQAAGKRARLAREKTRRGLMAMQRRLTEQQATTAAFGEAIASLEARMMAQLAAMTTRLEASLGELRASTADRTSLAELFEDFAQKVGNHSAIG